MQHLQTRPAAQLFFRRFFTTVSAISIIAMSVGGVFHANAEEKAMRPAPLTNAAFLYDGAPPEAMVALGRALFFDPILSGNQNIACGTCHDPARGSSDGVALSIGEGGIGFGPDRRTAVGVIERIPRNAQALWNIGAREYVSMFHDGRLEPDAAGTFASGFWSPAREDLPEGLDTLLAAQAMFPVLSPSEMAGQKGENPVATAVAEDRLGDAWRLLAARLDANPGYRAMFDAAFPELASDAPVSFVAAARALAAFQTVAFRSDESPFDRWSAGDDTALDAQQKRGFVLFSGKAGCVTCHSGPLMTDHAFHAIGVPQVGPGKGHGADTGYWRASGFKDRLEDEGRYRVTFEEADLFAFRTPSLRNVALTGPWGHNGAFGDLEAMVRHHLDSTASLHAYDVAEAKLLPLDQVIEAKGEGSKLLFPLVDAKRRAAFDLRDTWVHRSDDLRQRIAAAAQIDPVALEDDEVDALMAFLHSLTDPTAVDRTYLIPARVPSGLPPQPAASQDVP
ncbi:cytochrome c peroxidase [uncultured Roseobacter sp.]|uniref:cytochrome-c peroxidase n=1 Tax=uncultured Roseobacter sp. TaxID=114847 RepID=UPI00261965D3|nr:cytochrome c peroxidase [uncultured Roseobacter sp.]